jgi:beta-N-acetylhexosaminidase
MRKNGGMVWKQSIFQWLIVVTIMGLTPVMAQADHTLPDPALDSIQQEERQWVDSVYACMSTDERIGQLFMIRAHSNKGAAYEAEVARQISAYAVGGLCFFQGTPRRQVELTNYYQSISPWPMMISMDAEWGLGMRLKGAEVMNFPRQLTLGALRDNALIYQMGREVARQLRRIGTHVNFAPVVDINNNPLNPVINTRSFGEDRDQVTAKSIAYMKGLQDGHVMACAKHFPGHGDTDTDSHLDLPVLSHSRGRLDSMEMVPFIEMSRHGLQSIMVGHLHIPGAGFDAEYAEHPFHKNGYGFAPERNRV